MIVASPLGARGSPYGPDCLDDVRAIDDGRISSVGDDRAVCVADVLLVRADFRSVAPAVPAALELHGVRLGRGRDLAVRRRRARRDVGPGLRRLADVGGPTRARAGVVTGARGRAERAVSDEEPDAHDLRCTCVAHGAGCTRCASEPVTRRQREVLDAVSRPPRPAAVRPPAGARE